MKIDKKKLVDFLEKVHMDGTESIEEGVFNFTDTGVKIGAVSGPKTTRVDGFLMSGAFQEYQAIKEIGLQDLKTIIKIAKGFNKVIELNVLGNVLEFKEATKKVSIPLLDVQFLEGQKQPSEMEHKEHIKVKSSEIASFIGDVSSANSDFTIGIETKPKVIGLSNTGTYKFMKTIPAVEAVGGVSCKFGMPLVHALANLNGDLTLSVATNYPIKILEKTEDSVISIIVAPRVEQGEEDSQPQEANKEVPPKESSEQEAPVETEESPVEEPEME